MVVGDAGRAGGSAKATLWVEEALENARGWFPELSESELRGPLEQAFELAGQVGRGEREFHEVFEAELRRAVEERDVVGSRESVLPAPSSEAPRAFGAAAAVATEPADGARPEPPADRHRDRDRAFVLSVGALRFQEGLSPEEIQGELGIDATYYAESMRWLLAQVDQTLEGAYPAHLDRRRMAEFAAGLAMVEDRFAIERHVRECGGCATYLADLLEASLETVAPEAGAPAERRPTGQAVITYTRENAWTHADQSARRERRGAPALSLKAAELRRYSRQLGESPGAQPPAELAERPRVPRREPPSRRSEPRRRRLVSVLVLAAAAAIVALVLAASLGGGEDGGSRLARMDLQATADGDAIARQAETAARERAERRERRARAARRAARRRQAARRARRRQSERRAAAATSGRSSSSAAPSPGPAPVAPAPESSPPSSPPPSSAPSPPPSGPSGEFGLEP